MEKELFGSTSSSQAACPYNVFMIALQGVVRECGMEAAIAPVSCCAPWDRLKAAHAGGGAKRHLFNADALGGAICINNIWQSSISAQDGKEAHAKGDMQPDTNAAWQLVSELWRRAPVVPRRRLSKKGKKAEPRVRELTCNAVTVATQTDICGVGGVPQPSTLSATMAELVDSGGMPRSSGGVGSHDVHRHAGAGRVVTSDACVGESIWGDPFVWQTILGM